MDFNQKVMFLKNKWKFFSFNDHVILTDFKNAYSIRLPFDTYVKLLDSMTVSKKSELNLKEYIKLFFS